MQRLLHLVLATTVCAVGSMTGCASSPPAAPAINHIVLVKLRDPSLTPALLADSTSQLRDIPSVRAWSCGTPYDMGRSTVDGDYDVALAVGFDDRAGYQAYLDDPGHVAFVEAWVPRTEWLRIHDVQQWTPDRER